LPLVRRDDAGDLAGQVNSRRGAEAVLLRPVRQPVDSEHAGELEEERVAGVGKAAHDRAPAPSAVVPLPELRLAEEEIRPRLDAGLRTDLVICAPAGPRDELVRGAGRVVRLDGVVEERLVRIGEQL